MLLTITTTTDTREICPQALSVAHMSIGVARIYDWEVLVILDC